MTTPARRPERIDLDDEISALLQAVQEERSDPVAPDIAARRARAASGWHALATARHILIRLASSLRDALEHGTRDVLLRRNEVFVYVFAGLIGLALGVAVAFLLNQA